MKLYIGNQNYSTWSMRAWLIFAEYQIDLEIEKLDLFSDAFYTTLQGTSCGTHYVHTLTECISYCQEDTFSRFLDLLFQIALTFLTPS